MSRTLLSCLVVAWLSAPSATAANTVDVAVAIGVQPYASTIDDPRVLTGIDLLLLRGRIGAQAAGEYADLSEEGALIAIHVDAVYRFGSGDGLSFLIGAGPTFVNTGSGTSTWNGVAEIAHRAGRVQLFGRVRLYDYTLDRFREGDAGPNGPALSFGVRLPLIR